MCANKTKITGRRNVQGARAFLISTVLRDFRDEKRVDNSCSSSSSSSSSCVCSSFVEKKKEKWQDHTHTQHKGEEGAISRILKSPGKKKKKFRSKSCFFLSLFFLF